MALAFRHPMPAKSASDPFSATPAPVLREEGIECGFIGNLSGEIVKSIAVTAMMRRSFRTRFQSHA